MKTVAYGRVASCIVFVVGAADPDDDEWKTYLEFLKAKLQGGMTRSRALIVTAGGSPTAKQRKLLNEAVKPYVTTEDRAAGVTGSAGAPGRGHSITWWSADLRLVSPRGDGKRVGITKRRRTSVA